jgi:hypothetical protein
MILLEEGIIDGCNLTIMIGHVPLATTIKHLKENGTKVG